MPTPPHKHDDDDTKNGLQNGTTHIDEDADADAEEDASAGEIQVSTAPSKKRSSSMVEDEDARLARELQAQENRLARGRQTRGGNNTPKAKPKTKKKSSSKVKTGDDSDVDTEDSGTAKKRKAGGGFQKEFNLSFPLQEVVGAERVRVVCCCFVAMLQPRHRKLIVWVNSCPDLKWSRNFGITSRRTSYRIPATGAKYVVMRNCKRCSSRPRSTCLL